jgi:NCAIR mutase (PurE)-related protein
MQLRELLRAVASGSLSPEQAEKELKLWAIEELGRSLKLDIGRARRRGVPEVILAEGKSFEELKRAVIAMLSSSQAAIVSRLGQSEGRRLRELLTRLGYWSHYSPEAKLLRARSKAARRPRRLGRVGIITAGTADRPVALEAKLVAEELGCRVKMVEDAGVAGLQRTLKAVRSLLKEDVDIIVVAAGMEGALPSVVASLSPVPVLALPTSRGYGAGGSGAAALLSALQACPLGLACVNIDAGVGAGIFAALVARRAAERVSER